MEIVAENLGKKYNREWIFKNLNYRFQDNNSYAIIGPNGSGKSTLLQVISGFLPCSSGKINYFENNAAITPENFFYYISLASPYLELIEELNLQEIIDFHFQFKPTNLKNPKEELIEILGLEKAAQKEIKFFSSGMKQRVKLGLAFYSACPILLLDEPTSNLDKAGIEWYMEQVEKIRKGRVTIICSNQPYEYEFCKQVLQIQDFK